MENRSSREGHCRNPLPGLGISHVILTLYPWADLKAFPSTKIEQRSLQRKYFWIPGLWKSNILKSFPASSSVQLRSPWQHSELWLRSSPANMFPRSMWSSSQCCSVSQHPVFAGNHKSLIFVHSSKPTMQLSTEHNHSHSIHAGFCLASLDCVHIFFSVVLINRAWHIL